MTLVYPPPEIREELIKTCRSEKPYLLSAYFFQFSQFPNKFFEAFDMEKKNTTCFLFVFFFFSFPNQVISDLSH